MISGRGDEAEESNRPEGRQPRPGVRHRSGRVVVIARDRRLADRLLAGEDKAFAEFFDEYFPRLYRFALTRMDHDEDAAEEVTQATLCAAVAKLSTYRGEAALFTWLCTFCRHEISGFFERSRRRPPTLQLVEDSPEIAETLDALSAEAGEDPEGSLRRKQLAGLVHTLLDRLPGPYASALEWKYIEGIPVLEIAGRLGLTPKAAESLLTRARQSFREGFAALASQDGAKASPQPG